VDIDRQIAYWRDGSDEDMDVAVMILEKGRIRHALFFIHLALERILKAHVVKTTRQIPPKIHDLLRLADQSGLSLTPQEREWLGRIQQYCLAGRYPEFTTRLPARAEADAEMEKAREVLTWLKNQLH
jgi:HEPN domain-containing protein